MTLALFGSLDYAVVFASAPLVNESALVLVTLMMLVGGMAKSAQVPLHSWLAATSPFQSMPLTPPKII